MSLTSLLNKPDIKKTFKEYFPKPEINQTNKLLAPPITKNYALVGTSFDYLLRFKIENINKTVIKTPWIASESISILKKYGKLIADEKKIKNTISIIEIMLRDAENDYRKYLKTGKINDKLIESSIKLGQIDIICRAGKIPDNLNIVEKADIKDIKNLIKIVDPQLFKSKDICILNPEFGKASELVGGADADIIIDDTLIDIKTTKNLKLNRNYYNQLIGYYILNKIGKIDGLNKKININNVGIYFSRHGFLFQIPVSQFNKGNKFKEFIKWFKKEADNPLNII